MMKSSSIYKTGTNLRKDSNAGQQDFIKGTQVTKDFQLIAEPIIPKPNNPLLTSQNLSSQQYSGSMVHTEMKGNTMM